MNRKITDYHHKCIERYAKTSPLPGERIDRYIDLVYSKVDAKALLESDDTTFFHDMNGIFAHMDRTNGVLGDFFVPRVGFEKQDGEGDV